MSLNQLTEGSNAIAFGAHKLAEFCVRRVASRKKGRFNIREHLGLVSARFSAKERDGSRPLILQAADMLFERCNKEANALTLADH